MKVVSYAATTARGSLERFEYEPEPLGPDEVDVAVTHCGICHTDSSMVDNEWGFSQYPVVAGHETVGTVVAIGANVDSTRLHIGRRVGVGAICGACMNCEWCLAGKHSVCPARVDTVMRGHLGGFASHVRAANWQFVYPIPDAIASEHAGPLLCAGATVFTPMLRYGVRPTDRVAVVGIGGLGHLALQFSAKWGCAVTAISSSRKKEAQARRFGATAFIDASDTDELAAAAGSFDFILSTVPADLPWNDYVAALRPRGTLCIVGGPQNAISVGAFDLLPAEKVVAGGIPGSPVETVQMLDFAARHNIRPTIETFSMTDANRALDHVRRGRARFRAVLVA
ncbi:NAD(P)-dependent alcohol dehydrogenase [Mycolicibacterium sp. P9-22]|uniref:NAD(P)-dependent alcohol dehydrogenase n=1 Tax=Mycolicibacterium sp. P9-22 TaxID=2024613 RepID=UPI0011EC9C59|nr:NAD(P)-dependent alcohol dehydrogenase [Mycolicibacterium sp. P9-22]KAA0113950.1 NAD(P)-dependent alcohol dehydrogenase [Mycolicibacterium sp. P9-22]